MLYLNKVVVVGELVADPYVRDGEAGGSTMACLRLSIQSLGSKGEVETIEIDVVVYGRQAETSGMYLSKGRRVLVEGKLRRHEYVDREGRDKTSTEIAGSAVQFL